MEIEDIIEFVSSLDGVLVLQPKAGDGSPEIAWGDVFFYYAPDGIVPKTQPFATIVTKDYPGDDGSQLGRPGVFRVNVAAGAAEFHERTGGLLAADASVADVVIAHPVYSSQNWLAVVSPGPQTSALIEELLRAAHGLARERFRRGIEQRSRTERQ